MNEEMDKVIGSVVGKVHACDVDKDGKAWGQTLRAYIEIEIQKPLPRGRMLNVSGNKNWIPFTYEKLPKICFQCGRICHGNQVCNRKDYKANEQYDSWLGAEYVRKSVWDKKESPKKKFGPDSMLEKEIAAAGKSTENRCKVMAQQLSPSPRKT